MREGNKIANVHAVEDRNALVPLEVGLCKIQEGDAVDLFNLGVDRITRLEVGALIVLMNEPATSVGIPCD